jgi:hypothetical protein
MSAKPFDAMADIRSARHSQCGHGRGMRYLKRQLCQHTAITGRISDEVRGHAVGDCIATSGMCGPHTPD